MRLQMGGVDHQLVRLPAPGREPGEDTVEHTQTAPSDDPVVDRLVRSVRRRRIAPEMYTGASFNICASAPRLRRECRRWRRRFATRSSPPLASVSGACRWRGRRSAAREHSQVLCVQFNGRAGADQGGEGFVGHHDG